MLNHALKYLSIGFSVIPLRPKGKEPLIPWTEWQTKRPSAALVTEWFQKWPDANIGVVTGPISKSAVIDLDGPEGIEEAQRLGLTSSMISLTGNGKHLWFRMDPLVTVSNAVRLIPGVDVRGEGGYVVAPPSVHESGKRYRWLNPLKNVETLPEFPKTLLDAKVADSKVPPVKQEGWSGQSPTRQRLDIAKALEEMKDGNIDDTLTSILGRMRRDRYTAADALCLLQPHVDRVNAESGHLEAKIKNIWARYEPKTRQSERSVLYSERPASELIIHSPTNPDDFEQYERLHMAELGAAGTSMGLQTGYPKLDEMLQGGLKSSRLFTVAARTGVGKTNWLLGVARTLCDAGKKVLLFSTEMPYAQIWERYIETLSSPERFREHQFYVCDSFAPNLERVEEAINEIKPDVFMFDHINHVSEEVSGIGEFMQGLNFLRRKYDVAGIVTAQLNRQADWVDLKTGEKVTPRMSMIKGSGTIEQASSRVLLLSETRVTPEGTEIVGNLDKNDNGPKGLMHFMLKSSPYRIEQI